jgi:hypothetical protein
MAETLAVTADVGGGSAGSKSVESKRMILYLRGHESRSDPLYCVRPKKLPQYMVVFLLDNPPRQAHI